MLLKLSRYIIQKVMIEFLYNFELKLGSSAVGIKTKEGVILVVERRISSSLMEPKSIEKISEVYITIWLLWFNKLILKD